MINEHNFKDLLKALGYQKAQSGFEEYAKQFGSGGAVLKVNFCQGKIIYPEAHGLTVNNRHTCDFSQNENFVVFECVHRLLAKGYQPADIEIEPRWQVGRGASGGRADILVRHEDENGEKKSLLIIECKTWGAEFDRERQKMLGSGGQLFSYLQQDRNTRYLCLYASNFEGGAAQYRSAIVKIADRDEDIAAREKGDKDVKLYSTASTAKELFEAWKENFSSYFHYNGIFEEDVNAYKVELKPLKGKDLLPLEEANSVFNTFMEILRHNNISDNANAFNRILSLLLCKIVDEQKGDDEVLDFQVKEGETDAKRIQDRLQKLYQQGMAEYLKQEVVYFGDEEIDSIINLYPRQTPIHQVREIFHQIKYYTSNEFAFKEVHNEELFEQNARVLHEVIKMLQNYRFRYNTKQQMLGDFFELLLNHGVKQSEGQFFTPTPLVRFIITSVGLDMITDDKLRARKAKFLPKILDYACGAGHFLTESIDDIQRHLGTLSPAQYSGAKNKTVLRNLKRYQESVEWAADYIFGIEKDYRLARTSQIACFLNGDGDANVIYGDGLEEHARLGLKSKFDVVVANPPYAVRKFKNYLRLKGGRYTLLDAMTENAKEIEVLFLERTAQVLAPGGRAGIILPVSILTGGGVYEKAREMLLAKFRLIAIAEMGGRTFAATGTQPAILFLQRRSDNFAKDRDYIASDLFGGVKRKRHLEYIDSAMLLKKYVAQRGIGFADYASFMKRDASPAMQKTELFADYQRLFDDLPETRRLKEQSALQPASAAEIEAALRQRFYRMALEKEKEKFYFFMLTLDDQHKPQNVVLVKAGEKDAEKAFLGYTFSERRGSEGIQIRRDGSGAPATKMHDADDRDNWQKVAAHIRANFLGNRLDRIDAVLQPHVQHAPLTTLMDYSRTGFIKAINLAMQKSESEVGRHLSNRRLGDVAATIEMGDRPKGGVGALASGAISLGGEHIHPTSGQVDLSSPKYIPLAFYNEAKSGKVRPGDILLCKDGSPGKVALLGDELGKQKAMINEHVFLLRCDSSETQRWLFYFLASPLGQERLRAKVNKSTPAGLPLKNLSAVPIPDVSLAVQRDIVRECGEIDANAVKARDRGKAASDSIEKSVKALFDGNRPKKKVGEILTLKYGMSLPERSRIAGDFPVYGANGIVGHHNAYSVKGPCIVVGRKGSAGEVTWCDENCTPIDTTFYINALDVEDVSLRYAYYVLKFLNLPSIKGGLGPGGVNKDDIHDLDIPVPPFAVQEELLDKIRQLEGIMAQAQQAMDAAAERKWEVMKKYL